MDISAVGIDLAKTVFHVHGINERGGTVFKKKLSRAKLLGFIRNLKPTLIGMEACAGAHHWAREFIACGHEVRLMAPQFVKPYVKSNKNDMADAEAICEAVTRESMRFVTVKSVEQQEIMMVHRVRSRLVKQRTMLSNEVRGLLQEFGVVLPKGPSYTKKFLLGHSEECVPKLSSLGRRVLMELREEFLELDSRIAVFDKQILQIAKNHPMAVRLMTIPGVGPITSTAIMASVGDAKQFANGRQFAAWLGLVPKQVSTGGKPKLLGISKRGDKYLRTLVIHGARAVMRVVVGKEDRRSVWVRELKQRKGTNKAAVALANKTARTMWVLLTGADEHYREFAVA